MYKENPVEVLNNSLSKLKVTLVPVKPFRHSSLGVTSVGSTSQTVRGCDL